MPPRRRRPDPPLHGLLLVDKPQGITSHGVVSVVRRLLGMRKVGHTGTLDPLATGLLPLLVGDATRLSAHLSDVDKEYLVTAHLGITTDTLDADGEVVATRPLPPDDALDAAHLAPLLARFVGPQSQAVPQYSAVKVQGVALHTRARAGEALENVPPRQITVHALDLLTLDPPRLTLRVQCSKGTYVRQLVSDLGELLGCGAHVAALRRTRVGSLGVEEAAPLATLEAGPAAARAHLVSLADWLGRTLPSVPCDPDAAARTRKGQRLPWSRFGSPALPVGSHFVLFAGAEVVAVAERLAPGANEAAPSYRLLRVFSATEPGAESSPSPLAQTPPAPVTTAPPAPVATSTPAPATTPPPARSR